jgi:signal peptidase I
MVGWKSVRLCWPFARYVVHDTSMRPTLRAGDRVLVWRWSCLGGIHPGDVVVVRHPEQPGLHLVKRVAAVPGEPSPGVQGTQGFAVLGDEPAASRDSRAFGRLPADAVVGRVVWRYLPGARRGRLR